MWISLANHHLPSPDERRSFFHSATVPQRYFCEITLLPAIYVHLSITCVYLCLYIMTIYSVVIIGICTYLILPRSASVHSIICCKSLLTTCCLALFSNMKNVNKAQCPQDFYTKPFQQGTTPSIGTHSVYQMSRLHYVTSASF